MIEYHADAAEHRRYRGRSHWNGLKPLDGAVPKRAVTHEVRPPLSIAVFRFAVSGSALPGYNRAIGPCRGAWIRVGMAGRTALQRRPFDYAGAAAAARRAGRKDTH